MYLISRFLIFLTFFCLYTHKFQAQSKPLTGSWYGTLEFSGMKLRMVYNFSFVNDTLKATFDSPDEGAKGILVDKISIDKDSIKLFIKRIQANFNGVFLEDSSIINGVFKQNGYNIPLRLKRTPNDFNRPQEPKKPFSYKEENITYQNSKAGITLSGTLTMPSSGKNFTAVLLISGSGPQDRDESLMGHKPFLVLADYLTKKGIAVLRIDDRGVGQSTGKFQNSTSLDFADDILAGINYLKTRKEINSKHVGLIGHSEGGMVALISAENSSDISFIVLMAAPGIEGEKVLITQTKELYKRSGLSESEIEEIIKLFKKASEIDAKEKNLDKQKDELMKLARGEYTNLSENQIKRFGINYETLLLANTQRNSPWMKYLLAFDPKPILEKIKIPILAINGSKDVQVLADINLKGIEDALIEGGNKNYEVRKLEGLNHLFQTAMTGLPNEYAQIEETISPTALNIISEWILKVIRN